MNEKTAELLRESSFGTLQEVVRFIDWYIDHEHRSDWDETRYRQAVTIIQSTASVSEKCKNA